jgi:hypothetical protein
VLPYANTDAMQVFLDSFAETLAVDEHAAMILDQAGMVRTASPCRRT